MKCSKGEVKTMEKKNNRFIGMLLVLFFTTLALPVQAATDSLTLTPLLLDNQPITTATVTLPADGKKHQVKLSLTNFSQTEKSLQLLGSDPVTDTSGKIVYQSKTPQVSNQSFKVAPAIKAQSFTIGAEKTQTLNVAIETPSKLKGTLTGAIQVLDENVSVATVPIQITGTKGAWEKDFIKITQFKTGLISDLPAFMVQTTNESGQQQIADFDVKITRESFLHLQDKTWHLTQNAVNLAPYSTFEKGISLQGEPIATGNYHLSGVIKVGDQQFVLDRQFTLSKKEVDATNQAANLTTQIPYLWLIGIAVLLGIVLIGVIYLALRQNKKRT